MSAFAKAEKALIVRIESGVCGIPLARVIETMRALPIETVSGAPPFVQGVAVIRGIATPVVDLGALLAKPSHSPGGRFVTLRVADRQVALSVNAVVGIQDLNGVVGLQKLPPLLGGAEADVVEWIGTLDEQFLMVLQSAWKIPDEVWAALTEQETAS